MGLNVLLLACRATGYQALKRITSSRKHRVVAVVTYDFVGVVNDGVVASDFNAELAASDGKLLITDRPDSPENFAVIQNLSPDVGLSIGWRRLVTEPLISLPRLGFFNFHTSDLPKYRGFASTSWAILNGDNYVGVCVHRMLSGKADEGDIYLRRRIDISGGRDISDVFSEAPGVVAEMALELLDGLSSGTLRAEVQDESRALFSFPRRPSDGWIDWNLPAAKIDCLVRSAARPYPGAFTCWNMKRMIVWRGHCNESFPESVGVPGHVARINKDLSIDVLTGDGVYTVEEIQLEGESKPVRPGALIKGAQQRLGMSPGEVFQFLSTLKGSL